MLAPSHSRSRSLSFSAEEPRITSFIFKSFPLILNAAVILTSTLKRRDTRINRIKKSKHGHPNSLPHPHLYRPLEALLRRAGEGGARGRRGTVDPLAARGRNTHQTRRGVKRGGEEGGGVCVYLFTVRLTLSSFVRGELNILIDCSPLTG